MRMIKSQFFFSVLVAFFVCHVTFFAQSGAVGSIKGGLAKGGAGSTALVERLGSLVDPGIFNRLANKSKKTSPVKKATSSRTTSKTSKTIKSKTPPLQSTVLADAAVLKFRSTGNSGVDETFADLLTQDDDVKQMLLLIFAESKKAYDTEAVKMGRKNDLALAMTFFIATTVTVYNDAPEPSDAATENLYQALADSMRESTEIAQMSNQDKQTASDTLVYVSGLILAGYLTSKQGNDEATLNIYRQAAADTLLALTGITAEKMEFDSVGLNFKP